MHSIRPIRLLKFLHRDNAVTWRCLRKYNVRHLCAYIKPHCNNVFLWTLQKISELYHFLHCRQPSQMNSFWRSLRDFPKNLWKLSANGKYPTQGIRRNSRTLGSRNCAAINYLCPLFKAGLIFLMKYFSYDSLSPICPKVLFV